MLWIGGQLTTPVIVSQPHSSQHRLHGGAPDHHVHSDEGEVERPKLLDPDEAADPTSKGERNLIFAMGVSGLLFVPIFKTVTHLASFHGDDDVTGCACG